MNKKERVAQAVLSEIHSDKIIGIGTGSTVDYLIDLLPTVDTPTGFVSSSKRTTQKLLAQGFQVKSLNETGALDLYIDGADQVLENKVALKGGGGAHTLEKLMAANAKQFIGIISDDKLVTSFDFPVIIEVYEEARSYVSRQIVALGGTPSFHPQKTDLGHQLIHVTQLNLVDPEAIERELKCIVGVIEVGIFATRRFDKLYIADKEALTIL